MKRFQLVLGGLLTGLCITACAQSDSFRASPSISAGTAISSPVYSIKQCHFRVENLEGGVFRVNKIDGPSDVPPDQGGSYEGGSYIGSFGNDTSFLVHCHTGASNERIDDALDARIVGGKWIWKDAGEPFIPAQHFKTYTISGKNWTGRVVEFNDITGEIEVRNFNFCLFETDGPQILCGEYVETLGDPRLGSQFRKALAVIKTIVFVDPPAAASPTPDASGAPH